MTQYCLFIFVEHIVLWLVGDAKPPKENLLQVAAIILRASQLKQLLELSTNKQTKQTKQKKQNNQHLPLCPTLFQFTNKFHAIN